MAHFFFISGSEGKKSDWQAYTRYLCDQGHEVSAFGWTEFPWQQGVEGVLAFLEEKISEAKLPVLVGHSAGGLLISRIARRVAVQAEIYLAALAPQPGMSFLEQMFESPVEVFHPEWLESAYHPTSQEAAILQELYEIPFSEYAPFSPRLYVIYRTDQEIQPEWQTWIAETISPTEILSLNVGHYGHVAQPENVCDVILSFIQKNVS